VKNKITYLSIIFALISTLLVLTGCESEDFLTNESNINDISNISNISSINNITNISNINSITNTNTSIAKNELESNNETPKNFVVDGYVFKFGTYDAYPIVNGEYENYFISTLVINSDLSCVFTETEKSTGNITDTKVGKITVDGENIIIETDSPSSGNIIDSTYYVKKKNCFTDDIWKFTYIGN
jgi:hypothetical protein